MEKLRRRCVTATRWGVTFYRHHGVVELGVTSGSLVHDDYDGLTFGSRAAAECFARKAGLLVAGVPRCAEGQA